MQCTGVERQNAIPTCAQEILEIFQNEPSHGLIQQYKEIKKAALLVAEKLKMTAK